MMAKQRGLGRGLDALLTASGTHVTDARESKKSKAHKESATILAEANQMHDLAIDKIKIGKYQPRQIFDEDELADLALSIKHNGVIQPIIVRKHKDGFELIAGERRLRASKLAGITKIPAIVRDFSNQEALEIALIENIQRKDLNVVEEANGYKRLIHEFKLTHEELAKVTGRSRSHITNSMRLLNLSPDVLALLLAEHISMGHARALLPLEAEMQLTLAKDIINGKLTTSEVERRVAKILHGNVLRRQNKGNLDPKIVEIEKKIAKKFGMDVRIKPGADGQGKIIINYDSLDKLKQFI